MVDFGYREEEVIRGTKEQTSKRGNEARPFCRVFHKAENANAEAWIRRLMDKEVDARWLRMVHAAHCMHIGQDAIPLKILAF